MDICSQTVPVDERKLKEHGGLWSSVIKQAFLTSEVSKLHKWWSYEYNCGSKLWK